MSQHSIRITTEHHCIHVSLHRILLCSQPTFDHLLCKCFLHLYLNFKIVPNTSAFDNTRLRPPHYTSQFTTLIRLQLYPSTLSYIYLIKSHFVHAPIIGILRLDVDPLISCSRNTKFHLKESVSTDYILT
jgi:hypothetical protein